MTIFRRLCILIFALSLCATSPAFGLFGFGDTKSPVEEGLDNIKEKIEDLEKSLLKFSKSETKKVAGYKKSIVGVLSKELIFSFPKAIFEKMRENQKRQKDYVARLLSVLDDNEYGTIQDRIVGSVPLPNRNRGASQSDRKQTLRTFFQKKFKKDGEKPALDDIFNVVLTSTQVQELPPHVRMRHHKEIDKIMSLETILLVLRNLYRVIEGGSLFQRTTTLKDVSEEFAEQVREAPDLAKNSVFKERLAAFKDFVKKVNETRTQIVNYLTNDLKIPQKKVSNRKSVSDLLSVEKKVHKLIQKAKGHTKKSKALFESSKKLLSFFQNTKQSPITMPLTIFDAQIVNSAFNDNGYTGSEATSEIPVNSNYLLDAMLSKDAFNNGPQGGNQNANRHGRYRLAGTSFFDIDDLTPKKSGKKPKETQLHKDLAEAQESAEKLATDLEKYRDEYITPDLADSKGTYWAYLNTRMKSVKNTLLASGLSDIEKRVGCLIALHRLKKRYFWQPAATANADPHRSDHKMVTSGYQRNGNDHPWLFEVDNGPYQSGAPHNVRKIIEDLKANHIFDHYITPLKLKPYHVDMPEYRRLHHALEKLKEYVDDSFFNDHVGEAGLQFNFPLTLTEAPLALADRFMLGTESEITEDFRVSKKDASRKREQSEQAAHDDWVDIKNERLQDVSDERIETMEQYGRARADRRAREAYVLKHGSSLKEKLKIRGRRLKEGVSDIGITHYKRDKRFKADDHYTDLANAYQAHTRDGLDEDKARGKAAAYADHKYSHNSPTAHYSGGDFGTGIDDNDPNVSDAEKAAASRFRQAYYDELRRIMKISDNTQLREIAASWFIRANYETFKNFARGVVLEAYDRALAVLKEAMISQELNRLIGQNRYVDISRTRAYLADIEWIPQEHAEKIVQTVTDMDKRTSQFDETSKYYSLENIRTFIKRSVSDAYDQYLAAETKRIEKEYNAPLPHESSRDHVIRTTSQRHRDQVKVLQQARTLEIIHIEGILADNELEMLKTQLERVESIIPGPRSQEQNVSSQDLAIRILNITDDIVAMTIENHLKTGQGPANSRSHIRLTRLNQTFGAQAPALIATYTRGLESANRILADVRADLDNNNLLTPPGGINIQTEGPQRFIEQFESIQKALAGANAVSNPIFSGVQKGEDNPFTVGRTAHTYGAEAEYLITRSMAEKAGNWNRFIREVWSNFTVYVKEISRTIAHKVKADTDAEHDEDVRHYVDLRRYLDALTLISSDEVPVGTPVDERSKWARNPLDIRNEDHLTRLGHMLNILGHFFYKHLPSENRERLELLQALKLHQSGYNELALILSDLDGRAPLSRHRLAQQITVAQLFRSLQDHIAQKKQVIVDRTLSYQELEAKKTAERTRLTTAYPGRDVVYDSAQMHITGQESREEQLRKLRNDAVFLMQAVLQYTQLHIQRLTPRMIRELQDIITTLPSNPRTHLYIGDTVDAFLTQYFDVLIDSRPIKRAYEAQLRNINPKRGAEYQKHMHDIFDTLLFAITQGRYVSPPERFPQGTVHGIENSASLNQAWRVFCQLISDNIDVFIQRLSEEDQNGFKRSLQQLGDNYSYDNINEFLTEIITYFQSQSSDRRNQSNPQLIQSFKAITESVRTEGADLIRAQRTDPQFRYEQVAIMQSLAATFMDNVNELRQTNAGQRVANIVRQEQLNQRLRSFVGQHRTRRAEYTALRQEILTALQNLFDAVAMIDDLPANAVNVQEIYDQLVAVRTTIPRANALLGAEDGYPGAHAHLLVQFDGVDAAVGSLIREMREAQARLPRDRQDPSLLTNLETQLDTAREHSDQLQKARAYMALTGTIRAAMYDLLMAHKHDEFRMRSARLFIIALVAHRVTNTPEGNLERVQDELQRAAPDSGQTLTWQNICDELADMIVRISEEKNPQRSALIAAARKVRTTPLYSQEYETHLTALRQELSHLLPEDNDANRYVNDALIISELIDIGHSFSENSNDYYNPMANGLGIQHALSTNPRGVAQVLVEDIRNFDNSAIAGVPTKIRTADSVAFRQDLQTTITEIRNYLGAAPARARHHFDAAGQEAREAFEIVQDSIRMLVSRLSGHQFNYDSRFVEMIESLRAVFAVNRSPNAGTAWVLAKQIDRNKKTRNFTNASRDAQTLLAQLRNLRSPHTSGPAHPQPGPTAGAPAGPPSGTGRSGEAGQGHGGSGDGVKSLAQRIYRLAVEKTGTRATAFNPQLSWKQNISAARKKLTAHLKSLPMRRGGRQYVRKVNTALTALTGLESKSYTDATLKKNLQKAHDILHRIRNEQRAKAGGSDSSKSGNDTDNRGPGGSSPPSAGRNNGQDNTHLAAKTFSAWRDHTQRKVMQRAEIQRRQAKRDQSTQARVLSGWKDHTNHQKQERTALTEKAFGAWRDTTEKRTRQRAALNQLESTRNNLNVRSAFNTWRSAGASASGASASAPPLDVQQYTIAPRTPRGPAILAVARQVYEAATHRDSQDVEAEVLESARGSEHVNAAQTIMTDFNFTEAMKVSPFNTPDIIAFKKTAIHDIGALARAHNKSARSKTTLYRNAYNSLRRLLAALVPETAHPGSLPTDELSSTAPPFAGRNDGPHDTQLAVGAHHHADPYRALALHLARSGQTVTPAQIATAMINAVTPLPDLISSHLRPSPDLRTARAAAEWLTASSSTPHLLTDRAPEHAIVPHTANAASVSLTPETARQFEQLIQGVMNAIQQASLNERAQVMARLNRLPEPQIIALNAVAASLPDHLKNQFNTLTLVRPDNSMTNQLTDVRHDHSDNGARNPELAAKTSGAWRSRAEASTSGASAGTPPLDVQQYTIAPRTPRGPAILAVARQVYEAATGESSLSTYPNPRNSFGQPINAKAYVEVAQNIMGASDFIDKVNSGDTLDLYNTALKNIGALAQNKSKKARNQVYETAYNSLRRLLAALNPETARPGSLPTDAPPSPEDMVTRHFVKPMNRALSQQRAMDRLQAVGAFKAEGQRAAARRATTTQPEPSPYVRASRHYHKNKTGQSAPPRGPLTGRPSWAETPPGIPVTPSTGALVRGSTPSSTARVPSPRPGTPPAPPFTVATAGHPSSTDLLVRAAQGNISATAALTGLSRLPHAEQYRLMGNILLTIPGLVRTLINYNIPGAKDLEPAAARVEDAITGHMDNGTLLTQTQFLTDGSDSPAASVALVRAVVDLVTQTGTLVSRLPGTYNETLQRIASGLPLETVGGLVLFSTLAQRAGFSLPSETFRFLKAAGARPLLADGTSTGALGRGTTPPPTALAPSPHPGTPPAPPLTVATAGAEAFPPSEDLGRLSPSNQADKELTDHVLTSIQDAISMTAVKHTKKNYTKTIQQVVTSRRAPDEPYLDVYLKYVSLALGELAGLVEKEINQDRTNDPLIPLHQNLKELARKLEVASGEVTESLDDPSNSKFENGRTLLREAISLVREVAETLSRAKDIALPSLSSSSSSDDSSDNDSDSSAGGAGGWTSRGGGGGGHNFGTGTILNPLSPSTRRGRARSLSPRGSRGRARIRRVRSASPSSRRPEALPSVRGAWGKAPVSDEAIAAAHRIGAGFPADEGESGDSDLGIVTSTADHANQLLLGRKLTPARHALFFQYGQLTQLIEKIDMHRASLKKRHQPSLKSQLLESLKEWEKHFQKNENVQAAQLMLTIIQDSIIPAVRDLAEAKKDAATKQLNPDKTVNALDTLATANVIAETITQLHTQVEHSITDKQLISLMKKISRILTDLSTSLYISSRASSPATSRATSPATSQPPNPAGGRSRRSSMSSTGSRGSRGPGKTPKLTIDNITRLEMVLKKGKNKQEAASLLSFAQAGTATKFLSARWEELWKRLSPEERDTYHAAASAVESDMTSFLPSFDSSAPRGIALRRATAGATARPEWQSTFGPVKASHTVIAPPPPAAAPPKIPPLPPRSLDRPSITQPLPHARVRGRRPMVKAGFDRFDAEHEEMKVHANRMAKLWGKAIGLVPELATGEGAHITGLIQDFSAKLTHPQEGDNQNIKLSRALTILRAMITAFEGKAKFRDAKNPLGSALKIITPLIHDLARSDIASPSAQAVLDGIKVALSKFSAATITFEAKTRTAERQQEHNAREAMTAEESAQREYKAATSAARGIQSQWRGNRDRTAYQTARRGVTQLQAHARGVHTRSEVARQHTAASRIQAGIRGSNDRRRFAAAQTIAGEAQRFARGRHARQHVSALTAERQREQSAREAMTAEERTQRMIALQQRNELNYHFDLADALHTRITPLIITHKKKNILANNVVIRNLRSAYLDDPHQESLTQYALMLASAINEITHDQANSDIRKASLKLRNSTTFREGIADLHHLLDIFAGTQAVVDSSLQAELREPITRADLTDWIVHLRSLVETLPSDMQTLITTQLDTIERQTPKDERALARTMPITTQQLKDIATAINNYHQSTADGAAVFSKDDRQSPYRHLPLQSELPPLPPSPDTTRGTSPMSATDEPPPALTTMPPPAIDSGAGAGAGAGDGFISPGARKLQEAHEQKKENLLASITYYINHITNPETTYTKPTLADRLKQEALNTLNDIKKTLNSPDFNYSKDFKTQERRVDHFVSTTFQQLSQLRDIITPQQKQAQKLLAQKILDLKTRKHAIETSRHPDIAVERESLKKIADTLIAQAEDLKKLNVKTTDVAYVVLQRRINVFDRQLNKYGIRI